MSVSPHRLNSCSNADGVVENAYFYFYGRIQEGVLEVSSSCFASWEDLVYLNEAMSLSKLQVVH